MINKNSLWFTFLFSVILVLSIIYVSMNDSDLSEYIISKDNIVSDVVVNESTELVALRVKSDEEMLETINNLQDIILSETTDLDDKNEAYENLLMIKNNKSDEEKIEKLIYDTYKNEAFVKINSGNVSIVIDSSEHSYELANEIINLVSSKLNGKKYVTVKFN